MSNVVKLELIDFSDRVYDAATVLDGAKEKTFIALAVLGETEDGEIYVAGNCNIGELFILWEKTKRHLIDD